MVNVFAFFIVSPAQLSSDALFKLHIDETQRFLVHHMGSIPLYYYDITFDWPTSRHNIDLKRPVFGELTKLTLRRHTTISAPP